jgi:hypothetical protein
VCTLHLAAGNPVIWIAALSARVCTCVGAQTSQPPARTSAVAFCGSIGACARNGNSYVAEMVVLVVPGSTCPRCNATCAVSSMPCAVLNSCSEDNVALGPSCHVILSFLRPANAAHVFLPTTATPEGTRTTSSTPGIFFVSVASNDATLPPKTGQRSMLAYTIPGSFTSIPDSHVPSTFDGMSSRCTWGLPISV